MGLGNRVYAIRADIDLGQLESTSVRPVGTVANGIYWFDLASSTFGINEWDKEDSTFTLKTPLVLTSLDDLLVGPPYTKGYDVAVCGHIHNPKLEINYMNSGDFCENSTCLVEDFEGKWKIVEVY